MGFNINKAKEKKEEIQKSFLPIELNESNVQEIFNNCLRKETTKNIAKSVLFSRIMGYPIENETVINFDENALLKNNLNIRYLYGQLKAIHTGENKSKRLSVNDLKENYRGSIWSQSKASLLELLYLGCNTALNLTFPFSKKNNDTTVISKDIVPTLSPKDPNFPAWWEEHKSEWEDKKKGGQEPADD